MKYSIRQVKETLELSNQIEASNILTLMNKVCNGADVFSVPDFYNNICRHISFVLEEFRDTPQGLTDRVKGLTVEQIGYILDRAGEPWPNAVIAKALQYKMLSVENKFYTLNTILGMKFRNIDIKDYEELTYGWRYS